MFTENNQPPDDGATCINCRLPLRYVVVATNQGKQAIYWCTADSCPKSGLLTAKFWPGVDPKAPAAIVE